MIARLGSGRRGNATSFDTKVARKVVKTRGREEVTLRYLRRTFPEARLLSNTLLDERVAEA